VSPDGEICSAIEQEESVQSSIQHASRASGRGHGDVGCNEFPPFAQEASGAHYRANFGEWEEAKQQRWREDTKSRVVDTLPNGWAMARYVYLMSRCELETSCVMKPIYECS